MKINKKQFILSPIELRPSAVGSYGAERAKERLIEQKINEIVRAVNSLTPNL